MCIFLSVLHICIRQKLNKIKRKYSSPMSLRQCWRYTQVYSLQHLSCCIIVFVSIFAFNAGITSEISIFKLQEILVYLNMKVPIFQIDLFD